MIVILKQTELMGIASCAVNTAHYTKEGEGEGEGEDDDCEG